MTDDSASAKEAPRPRVGTTQAGFMFLHGEKVALGLAIVILLGYGVSSTAMTSDAEVMAQADDATAKSQEKTDKYQKEVQEIRDSYKTYNAKADWEKVEKAKALNNWAGSYVSKIEIKEIEPRETPLVVTWECPTIEIESLDSVLGAVNAKFKLTPPKEGKISDKLETRAAKVVGYTVERRVADEKNWKPIKPKLDPKELTFADNTITPKTRYEYRMIVETDARARDLDKEVHKVKPPEYCEAKQIRTVGYFKIKLKSIMGGAGDQAAKVSFEVEKYDAGYGKSFTITPLHVEGDGIGSRLEGPDDDPKVTYTWEVMDKDTRKRVKVDFNTGWKIMKVEMQVEREIPYRQCKVRTDATGARRCEGVEIMKRSYKGNHVSLKDDEGELNEEWRPDLPKVDDKLCEEHANLKGTPIEPKSP